MALFPKHQARPSSTVPLYAVGSANMLNPGQTANAVPPPATAYTRSYSPLSTINRPDASETIRSRSAVVKSSWRLSGIINQFIHGAVQQYQGMPMVQTGGVRSSAYQPTLVGEIKDWTTNIGWYICYPAATVMLGGQHNLALSERVDSIKTIPTAGPANARMNQRPRFTKVQQVPRWSAVPKTYNTKSSPA